MSVPVSILPDRTRWGTRLLAASVVIVGANIASTQFVAARLHYHPALGAPLMGRLYRPWAWIGWKAEFEPRVPSVFRQLHLLQTAGLAATMLILLGASSSGIRRAKRHDGVHGTAHWASRQEIERTGLLSGDGEQANGVYVGAWREPRSPHQKSSKLYYLRHDGPEHVLALAPTRSGKGVGLVVPTLLSWPHSVVVNDQKAELWH
jgi:type IV secretion system protein VirD4